ncbi:MAG: hypothetical protein JKY51_03775 [Opitutaceae bacterium]|nr:hypothetical protein [Opitutaceae bacterium]
MKNLKNIIDKNLNGKKVFLLFILTNIVYAFMLLVTIPKVMSFSNGLKLLDMMPAGYNLEYINSLFNALGEGGRELYLYNQIPVDMIYPFLFGISNCLLLAYFLKKINKLDTSLFYLCLLPLVAGIADYFENFGIIKMLNNYPEVTSFSATATNIFSMTKSTSTTLYFVVLLIALMAFGIKKIKN